MQQDPIHIPITVFEADHFDRIDELLEKNGCVLIYTSLQERAWTSVSAQLGLQIQHWCTVTSFPGEEGPGKMLFCILWVSPLSCVFWLKSIQPSEALRAFSCCLISFLNLWPPGIPTLLIRSEAALEVDWDLFL
jgi:hypothetical protein